MVMSVGFEYLESLSMRELLDLVREVEEVGRDRQRIQTANKNRR